MSGDDLELHWLRLADLANLWAESSDAPSHIALLGEFDAAPLRGVACRLDVERVRADLARRVRRAPELGRRIHWTRSGEGRPVWVSDPAFDPLDHIGATTLPTGADSAAWSADRIVRRLDPARPLWRIEIVDALPDGRFGLLIVLHHVVADGLTGVAIVGRLLDAFPDATVDATPAPSAGPALTHRALVTDARRTRRRAVAAALRGVPRLPAALRRTARQVRDAAGDIRETAPATSLPRRVGTGRRLAVARFPLAELRAGGRAVGATVNDVLLSAVSTGLRELLLARGKSVDGLTLRASMPVGATGAGQTAAMLLLGLPVGDPDPRQRLVTITATTTRLKARQRAGGGDVFDVLHLPEPLARAAVRWMRRHAARHINLFVTNVPGPPQPLWLAGARLLEALPVAPLAADIPVAIAALSYAGTLTVAVNANAGVSDIDVLAEGIECALAWSAEVTGHPELTSPSRPARTFDPFRSPRQGGSSRVGWTERGQQ
ncbi:diacylglycerol O-acyltransferase [Pseudonocardia hierapolitana]|uniref:diacylglycerol O-acyltransferase n=1 Tax=Pseudonocardia hierapolitana TaxID=1128676 RepID=A0A561T571_9PSEU|nr:wax ester/triacylglycerol synthase domain-containing protein [Pseudonocardia hierapolitana]TWF82261.1 diacylglycerol O-acyltransferase [Pseudonocardia hierapolitana]